MAENPKDPITLRIGREDKDVLDALVYLLGKTSGATKSPNDVLGPVVAEYLRGHANDPGVQLSVQAAHEARSAANPSLDRAARPVDAEHGLSVGRGRSTSSDG